ncbi:MAG: hypothetical protein ACPKPY_07620 [Nitrososphaeraceae archaeon]
MTKKGLTLIPILEEMAKFLIMYCGGDVFKDAKPRTSRHVYERNLPII